MPALVPKNYDTQLRKTETLSLAVAAQGDAAGGPETLTKNIIMNNSTAVGPTHMTLSGQLPHGDGTTHLWKWKENQLCPHGKGWAYLSKEPPVDTLLSKSQGFLVLQQNF